MLFYSVCRALAMTTTAQPQDLTHTMCTSDTGKQVFGEAYRHIEAENMEVLVKQKCVQLMKLPKIDQKALAAARLSFCADAEALGVLASKAFAKTSDLPVIYRGVEVKILSQSYLEYFQYCCIAAIKGAAVDTSVLMPCLCENDLVPMPRPALPGKLDEALLTEANVARASIRDYAEELEDLGGESLSAMFRSKLQILKAMDRYIAVEDAFFASMTGDAGQAKFKLAVSACMSSDGNPLSWAEGRAKLDKLLETPFCKFSGRGLLSQAQTVLGWLRSGEAGRSPNCTSVVSDFLVNSRTRMANFCTTKTADEKTLMGKPALDHMFGLPELKKIAVYKWMMTNDQDAEFQAWTDAALATSGRKISSSRAEPVVAEAPKKRRKTAKAVDADEAATQEVATSYFKNYT